MTVVTLPTSAADPLLPRYAPKLFRRIDVQRPVRPVDFLHRIPVPLNYLPRTPVSSYLEQLREQLSRENCGYAYPIPIGRRDNQRTWLTVTVQQHPQVPDGEPRLIADQQQDPLRPGLLSRFGTTAQGRTHALRPFGIGKNLNRKPFQLWPHPLRCESQHHEDRRTASLQREARAPAKQALARKLNQLFGLAESPRFSRRQEHSGDPPVRHVPAAPRASLPHAPTVPPATPPRWRAQWPPGCDPPGPGPQDCAAARCNPRPYSPARAQSPRPAVPSAAVDPGSQGTSAPSAAEPAESAGPGRSYAS